MLTPDVVDCIKQSYSDEATQKVLKKTKQLSAHIEGGWLKLAHRHAALDTMFLDITQHAIAQLVPKVEALKRYAHLVDVASGATPPLQSSTDVRGRPFVFESNTNATPPPPPGGISSCRFVQGGGETSRSTSRG
jgi:hypothetical protein